MPVRMKEAADVFRSELVERERVRNAPRIVGASFLRGECDILHLALWKKMVHLHLCNFDIE